MRQILIVDDDVPTNEAMKSSIEELGNVKIAQAYTLQSASQLLTTNTYDLAILDVRLGDSEKERLGGLSLLNGLSGKATAALVVSGVGDSYLPSVVLSLRAFDFLAKPWDPADLLNKVQHALEWQERSAQDTGVVPRHLPEGLSIDPKAPTDVFWLGRKVSLSITELRLFYALIAAPGETIDVEDLATLMKSGRSSNALATHVVNLRQKFIEVDPPFSRIGTQPHKGYFWRA